MSFTYGKGVMNDSIEVSWTDEDMMHMYDDWKAYRHREYVYLNKAIKWV